MKDRILEDLRLERIPKDHREFGPLIFKALTDRLTLSDGTAREYLLPILNNLDLYSAELQGDLRKFVETTVAIIQDLRQRETRSYSPGDISVNLLTALSKTCNDVFDQIHLEKLHDGLKKTRFQNIHYDAAYDKPEEILHEALVLFNNIENITEDGWDEDEVLKRKAACKLSVKTPKLPLGSKCFGCGRVNCNQSLGTCPRHGKDPNQAGKKAKADFALAKKRNKEGKTKARSAAIQ